MIAMRLIPGHFVSLVGHPRTRLLDFKVDITDAPVGRLDEWHLVEVRRTEIVDIHILAFVGRGTYEAWITSPVRQFDPERDVVQTRSCKRYLLGWTGDELDIRLEHHLHYAMQTWGYMAA